jgi:hypothetical protein
MRTRAKLPVSVQPLSSELGADYWIKSDLARKLGCPRSISGIRERTLLVQHQAASRTPAQIIVAAFHISTVGLSHSRISELVSLPGYRFSRIAMVTHVNTSWALRIMPMI